MRLLDSIINSMDGESEQTQENSEGQEASGRCSSAKAELGTRLATWNNKTIYVVQPE